MIYMLLERNAFYSIAFFLSVFSNGNKSFSRNANWIFYGWFWKHFYALNRSKINTSIFLCWRQIFLDFKTGNQSLKSNSLLWEKMLLNQKHFFPKACILLIHKNILQEPINFTKFTAYWFESMIYMLLEKNAFDSIAFFFSVYFQMAISPFL